MNGINSQAAAFLLAALAVATVDSWGRRPLLLWGVSGIVVALLALGTAQVTVQATIWCN